MRPFIERYPKFLRGSPEFRDLQQALEPELLELWEVWESALDQLCVETASWGLWYWERTLGLPVDSEKDLEARRSRVRSRLMGADVTTVSLLERVAEIYTGNPAKGKELPEEFWVDFLFDGSAGFPRDLAGLIEALREIMPAHLGWGFRFSLNMIAYHGLHGSHLMEIGADDVIHGGLNHYAGLTAGTLLEFWGSDHLPGDLERHSGLTMAENAELWGDDGIPCGMTRGAALTGGTMAEIFMGDGEEGDAEQ